MSIGERMKQVRQRLGLTQATMAEETGITLVSYKRYEGSKAMPSADALESFSKLEINLHWLLTGDGEMLLKDMAGKKIALLNEAELLLACETIEEALAAIRKTIPPKQKAQLIASVYQLYVEGEGKVNTDNIIYLLKSAV